MRTKYITAALALAAMVGCQKDDAAESIPAEGAITITTASSLATRAEEKSVWSSTDKIGLFNLTAGEGDNYKDVSYSYSSESEGTVTFTPESQPLALTSADPSTKNNIAACYPQGRGLAIDLAYQDSYQEQIASEIVAVGNGDVAALTFCHVLSKVVITFENAGGAYAFASSTDDITKVELADVALGSISFESDSPVAALTASQSSKVEAPVSGGSVTLLLIPGDYQAVNLTITNNTAATTSSAPLGLTLVAGQVHNITADLSKEVVDFTPDSSLSVDAWQEQTYSNTYLSE